MGRVWVSGVTAVARQSWWADDVMKSHINAPSPLVSLAKSAPELPSFCRFPSTMSSSASETVVEKYRYEILFGTWLAVTGATFLRIKRQPYSTRLKIEQYESIFKGTSLSAVLIGIGITPARSTARRFTGN
jgi:hypothetical protein